MSRKSEKTNHSNRELIPVFEEISTYLDCLKGLGCTGFQCSKEGLEMIDTWGMANNVNTDETLDDIKSDLGDCTRCHLHQTRKNIVFGDGNPQAKIVFVGEAPGADEDQQGLPFVGRAGRLLTDIIKAMGLKREDVYICNIIKCRPPGNRNPLPEEIKVCSPFLERQIEAISPDYICTLGAFAVQTLLETNTPISRLRGKFHTYKGVKLMPTFHPAYLLRNPAKKRETWEDIQQLMKACGL